MAKPRGINRRMVVGGVATVVVLGVGTSAWALTNGTSASYRTAAVARGAVSQTLTTTGTITPVRESDLDFQVAGTVARLLTKPGQHVHSGQRVAVLDRANLRAAVRSARSTLSEAQASLVSDEESQSSTASSSTSSPVATTPSSTATTPSTSHKSPRSTPTTSPSPTPSTGNGGTGSPVDKTLLAKIHRDQAAVLAGQQQADADLATAKAALKAETAACADELSGTTGTSDQTDSTSACVTATKTLLADQQAVAADQNSLATAEATLNTDLSAAITAVNSGRTGKSATDAAFSQDSGTSIHLVAAVTRDAVTPTDTATTPITTTTPTGSGGSTVTAAKLAADQATIDSDRAAVATAKADLAQATLRSPISGKVIAVTIAKGGHVSGSSSSNSPALKVVGSRQSKVTINVTAAQVRQISTGLNATVTPDGAGSALSGTVVSIGQATTDAATGDTTYPVVITMAARPTGLVSGADAQVAIVLSHLSDVIVVPTSAVHYSGSRAYVEIYAAGKLTRRTVTVGAIGADVTQIKTGLSVGQAAVLADLNKAVPSSSTNLLSNTTGGPTGSFSRTGGPPSGGQGFSGPPPGGATLQSGG